MKNKIQNLLSESPLPCDFKKGDKVIYTNDAGIEFEMIVVGFTDRKDWPEDYLPGRFINISQNETGEGSAWWFPHKPSELRKI